MLKLINIKKSYQTGTFKQQALNKINLEFRKNEFVTVLGASGSGKTTLLNIIGGLDRYDSGDLIINGKSTKKFKDTEWDAYRNNSIGFIFQSYNLINHISVLENVEMGMTLSGVSAKKRKNKALEVLKRVGLKEHAHKKPNQLSGGQMQRVAIARALTNDPDIVLADEPTGALDSKTSIQIMELIKEIAKEKLVIMVTHNADLANQYANRIVEFKDGELINDSNPIKKEEKTEQYHTKKTSMSFLTALKLSFNNIVTKKGRTFLTAFASSIGIIGIALILSLSNGFKIQIDKFESETLSSFPIIVSATTMETDAEQMKNMQNDMHDKTNLYTDAMELYPYDLMANTFMHENKITEEYVNYIKEIDKNLVSGLSFQRMTNIKILRKIDNVISEIPITSKNGIPYFAILPEKVNNNKKSYVENNFDILYGENAEEKDELILLVDSKNRVNKEILELIGFDTTKENIKFEDIVGTEFKVVLNDDMYQANGNYYNINSDLDGVYNKSLTLKIVGIARGNKDNKLNANDSVIAYNQKLMNYIIENNSQSKIAKKQQQVNYNVLTGENFPNTEDGQKTKQSLMTYLGAVDIPFVIYLYPHDFETKEAIVDYLDEYNKNLDNEDKIIYNDLADTISSLSGGIMDAITIVLISFSAISLIVSSIMIGIITYISVLERTKEIGILRALGARKKDITRVFNAETFIIGLLSGLIGITVARLLIIPTNIILKDLTDLNDVARLNPIHALILVLISVTLTIIGGYIPAKMASRKDPVEALRTE